MISFSLFAQDEKPRFKRHFFEVAPIALTFKRQVNIHQHLEYRFLITPYLYLNAATTGTFIRKFDYSGKHNLPNMHPFFNESSLVFGYQYAFSKLTESNRGLSFIGVDAGYHYMQYANAPFHDDYAIIDTTALGFRMLGGFRTHSLKAGLTFQYVIYSANQEKSTIRFRHYLSLAYLYGLDFQQPTYIETSPASAIKAENLDVNTWRFRNGFRVEYTFQHFLTEKVGLLYGYNFTCAPSVTYSPNEKYFVYRGSEASNSIAINFRIGITF